MTLLTTVLQKEFKEDEEYLDSVAPTGIRTNGKRFRRQAERANKKVLGRRSSGGHSSMADSESVRDEEDGRLLPPIRYNQTSNLSLFGFIIT